MKVNVIYWSGTGNTQMMAEAVAEGAQSAGAQVNLIPVAAADSSSVDADVVLMGCPAMGAENLEEGEFEPWYASVRDKLSGKKVGLFGSYDWGDGEWMRTWQSDVSSVGGALIAEGLICNNTPGEAALAECRALGVKAAS